MTRCHASEEDVVALAFGEEPEDAPALRAHVAGCSACGRLHEEARHVLRLADARPAPDPFAGLSEAGRRAAAADIADLALEGAGLAPRGPVVRLADGLRLRYAESSTVRFFAVSAGLHAAAAAILGIWLLARPDTGGVPAGGVPAGVRIAEGAPSLESGGPVGPLAVPGPRFPGAASLPFPGDAVPLSDGTAGARESLDAPVDVPSFPTEEFRRLAGARFAPGLRERRLAAAWGDDAAPRTAQAVQRGLRWLAYTQAADGRWAAEGSDGATVEAVRAFLADGATPLRRGPWGPAVRAGVDALLRSQDPLTGLLGGGSGTAHGPALAALAEAYGLDFALLGEGRRAAMERVLRRSVEASASLQRADGAFPVVPGGPGDAAATLRHAEGLALARAAGIPVDAASLERAATWIARNVDPAGRLAGGGDAMTRALLSARAWALADTLGLDAATRSRLRAAVLEDAGERALRRDIPALAGMLEGLVAARDGDLLARRGADLAAAALGAGAGDGFPRRAGGGDADAAATAAMVRALTAPFRVAAP